MDKESRNFLDKIGCTVVEFNERRKKNPNGAEILRDTLCKEFFSSCAKDNEQRLCQMAEHQGISTGMVTLNAAKETYERIKPQLTKKQQREAEVGLSRSVNENRFYGLGQKRGGGDRKTRAKYYTPGLTFPVDQKPLIQKAAKEAGLSAVAFLRQTIYEKIGVVPERPVIQTKQQREDYTTVDAVLPLRDLTEV